MTDIYDRSKWPASDDNPLVLMLKRSDQWYSNEEIVSSLGLSKTRSLLSQETAFKDQIRESDTGIEDGDGIILTNRIASSHSGKRRMFNRRALVIACMRTNTVNAAAFRDWMATQIAEDC